MSCKFQVPSFKFVASADLASAEPDIFASRDARSRGRPVEPGTRNPERGTFEP